MPKEEKDINCGIYIGNIPAELTKEAVESLFKKYNVKASNIHRTGRKTVCFMKLTTDADAINAVREMSNKIVNGRKLIVKQFEDKRALKHDHESNKDSDSHHALLTSEDFVPPLETPSHSHNASLNDSISFQKFGTPGKLRTHCHAHLKSPISGSNLKSEKSSPQAATCGHGNLYAFSASSDRMSLQAHNSHHNHSDSSFHQLNESRQVSQMKENSFHSQLLPKHRSTHWRSVSREKKRTGQSNENSQFSTDLYHSLNKPSKKFEYVHCTRKVIAYNPRDLQNNEMNNVFECSSEAVNVRVVNFPFGTTKYQILQLFEDFSPIEVYIDNNLPGYDYTQATVTLPSMDAAEAAIMELDNTIYRRRTLIVSIADDGDYDEEGYYGGDDDDDDDSYYYGPDGECSEQGTNEKQFCDKQLSRRFHDVHLS